MGADGRDCLSVVMERETEQRNSEGRAQAEFEKAKTPRIEREQSITVAHRYPGWRWVHLINRFNV